MVRSTKLWVGKTDNSTPPPRVKLRVFNQYDGKCYLTGQKITAGSHWQLDHIIALCNGGSNCESNLAPVLDAPHKAKTKQDIADKAKVNRLRQKHFGIADKKTGFRKPSGMKFDWKRGRYEHV